MGPEKARENAQQIEHEPDMLRELSSRHRYGESWSYTKSVVTMFKALTPILNEDGERLWSACSDTCQ